MTDATFIGADIAWSTTPDRDSTGLCTIDGNTLADVTLVTSDEEILNYVVKREADFLGIDAPLVVANDEGQRPVERELQRRGVSVYAANRSWFEESFGGVRGEDLVAQLERYGYTLALDTATPTSVIEVYPNPTMKAIIGDLPPYKNTTKSEMFHGLRDLWERTVASIDDVEFGEYGTLVPERLDDVSKRNLQALGDVIDAFYSAYVLKLDRESSDRTEVFGDLDTGSILAALR